MQRRRGSREGSVGPPVQLETCIQNRPSVDSSYYNINGMTHWLLFAFIDAVKKSRGVSVLGRVTK